MAQWLVVLAAIFYTAFASSCVHRDYGNGATVCVCNQHECDNFAPITKLSKGEYALYTSSKDGDRFSRKVGKFEKKMGDEYGNNTLTIKRDHIYQSIFGFGGAFTDSAGINILSLSNATRNVLMRSYFSNEGLQYSMGRIPMAGTDFSTHFYTYDDVDNDYDLKYWSLQYEDYNFKIPLIHEAMELTDNHIKFFGSSWTAPNWMKTNNHYTGIGFLNLSMYDSWANYYLKFIEGYNRNNISIWGVTTGNEPANGYFDFFKINDMGWIPELQGQWIAENLGPTIRLSDYPYVKIMIVDDQRVFFPWVVRYVNGVPGASAYIDGSAVHFYVDQYVPAQVLSITHFDYPDKFIFASEACTGSGETHAVILGSWERAEEYLNSMMDDMNNWATGWMDWNLALNPEGGPTYVGNYVDSPIIVNKTADEFYKQPMFYAMGHFAKFVRPKSSRIYSKSTANELKTVVFMRPDDGTVAQIYNPTNNTVSLTVLDQDGKYSAKLDIPRRSINSLIYW